MRFSNTGQASGEVKRTEVTERSRSDGMQTERWMVVGGDMEKKGWMAVDEVMESG